MTTNPSRLCYISHNYRDLKGSGNKAKHDYETIVERLGGVNIGLPTTYYHSKIASFFLDLIGIALACCRMRKGDLLFLQYPLKKYFTFVCRMARLRKAETVVLIHDLGSMRRKKISEKKELQRLGSANYVIATNEAMEQWLKDRQLQSATSALHLHDYLSSAPLPGILPSESTPSETPQPGISQSENKSAAAKNTPHLRVVYAGAIAPRKNEFLLKMHACVSHYVLSIYGDTQNLPSLSASKQIELHPFLPADEFIAHPPGHFGLVWDGDSLEACTGNFGEYLRWNTPHKVSFYLRAGLPVIVWSQSALAPLIERLGIGISIDQLTDLDKRLATLSTEEYSSMQQRAAHIGQRIGQGCYLSDALRAISCKNASQ